MAKLRSLLALSAVGCLAACTASPSPGPSVPASASGSPTPSVTSSPSPTAGSGALVAALPAGCAAARPADTATVTFVAGGRAWAVAPDGSGLTCLFDVADPGPFAWGPKADRVLLGGLEVRSLDPADTDATRVAGSVEPSAFSWGRPVGKAVVFSTGDARLQKAIVGSDDIDDISPEDIDATVYEDVAYHPSGLAVGFVVRDSGGSEIWMASNTGGSPKRLVFSTLGSQFGPIAFVGSAGMLYAVRMKDGRELVIGFDLRKGQPNGNLWVSDRDVLRLVPGPSGDRTLLDAGSGCDDRQAVFSDFDGTDGSPLLPAAAAPTTALGWADDRLALVGEGGCSGPLRLWLVDTTGVAPPVLVVEEAERGAVRVPEPTPAPPLPDIGVTGGFG